MRLELDIEENLVELCLYNVRVAETNVLILASTS